MEVPVSLYLSHPFFLNQRSFQVIFLLFPMRILISGGNIRIWQHTYRLRILWVIRKCARKNWSWKISPTVSWVSEIESNPHWWPVNLPPLTYPRPAPRDKALLNPYFWKGYVREGGVGEPAITQSTTCRSKRPLSRITFWQTKSSSPPNLATCFDPMTSSSLFTLGKQAVF